MSLQKIAHHVGHTLCKAASDAVPVYHMAGRLYLSSSGWLLLKVPNSLGKGAFDALDEPGITLPTRDTDDPNAVYNAHISVASADEVEKLGGGDKITERGHMFRYTLGPVKTVEPKTWNGVSKVWYITVYSPELRQLRKSYGLSPQPKEDWDFHITIGIRKTGVLHRNEKSKAAAADILPGGLADGKEDSEFDPQQLAKGRQVEQEHTTVPALPNEIAKDHLTEDPKYYDKLEQMESKKAREFVPGEDCCGCGASLEKDENGYCNSCGCEYDTGKDKGNYGKEASIDENYLFELLLKEAASTHTLTHQNGGVTNTYDVMKLMEILKDRPTTLAALDALKVNRSRRSGYSPKRMAAANTTFPGIVNEQGQLVDGRHRAAKMIEHGQTHFPVRTATAADLDAVKLG